MNTLPPSFGVLNDGSISMKTIEHIYPNWGVKSYGELDFFYVLKYMNTFHGCNYKKASGFKGCTIGVINNEDKGIVAPSKVEKFLSLSQFIEMTKEKQIVYGIKRSYIGEMREYILHPLYSTIEKASERLKSFVSNLNNEKSEFDKLKEALTRENTYYNNDEVIVIQEFELI